MIHKYGSKVCKPQALMPTMVSFADEPTVEIIEQSGKGKHLGKRFVKKCDLTVSAAKNKMRKLARRGKSSVSGAIYNCVMLNNDPVHNISMEDLTAIYHAERDARDCGCTNQRAMLGNEILCDMSLGQGAGATSCRAPGPRIRCPSRGWRRDTTLIASGSSRAVGPLADRR